MTANTSPQIYENKVRQVAGCVVLAPATLDPAPTNYHVLLVSSRADPSRWIFPKGGYEQKDGPDPRSAAARETWEEAGVRFAGEEFLTLLGNVDHTPKKKPHKPQRFWWYAYRASKVADAPPGSAGPIVANACGASATDPVLFECPAGIDWPEHTKRTRQWFSLSDARRALSKEHMAAALEMAIKEFHLPVEECAKPIKSSQIRVFRQS